MSLSYVGGFFAIVGVSYLYSMIMRGASFLEESLDAKTLLPNASKSLTLLYWVVHYFYIALIAIHFVLIPVLNIEVIENYYHSKMATRAKMYDTQDIESGQISLREAYPHLVKYFDPKYLRPRAYWDEDAYA